MKSLSLIWQIPLALLSFLFYKSMKFVIGILFILYLAIDRKKASQWRVLSAETLMSPLTLPVLMTKGPRWNTHAIIGTLGPFFVNKYLELDGELASHSAQSWIAVVYSFPSYRTITTIESKDYKLTDKWVSLPLKPGKYTLGLRYYNWSDKVSLPSVRLDGREVIKSQAVSPNINDFYHELRKRRNWFYLCLHYYIFIILRLKKWLPDSFVRGEYLPVGAPDTQFFYGCVQQGQSLLVDLEPSVLDAYNIYLTLYDCSSLPVSWGEIQSEHQIRYTVENNGSYLFRLRPKLSLTKPLSQFSLACQVQEETSSIQQLKIMNLGLES